ncbi:MAG: DUF368 domain-containing protein [Candidatus Sumerlaeia bacterium]|nr:DUF368 domain-containing protein [Candidatus Sumerlaeia bacterium]
MAETTPSTEKIPYLRLSITGVFMGLANLVPGVSGGTMVVALGLYQEFIDAMARLTRLQVSLRSIVVIAMLFGLAGVTVLGLASVIEMLMLTFLPGMLALFIGMTLGGGPTLWKDLDRKNTTKWGYIALGFLVMAAIAFLLRPGHVEGNWGLFFIGGIIGSAAMVLPGISGSYLLLIMGLYLPIISGISEFRHALSTRDMELLVSLAISLILPVGLGLVVGIVALSNLLKFLLDRFHQPTTAVLLGLLVGSVLGLYPFRGPDFDRMPRYALEQADGTSELRVYGFGWENRTGDEIHDQLMGLEEAGLRVSILDAQADQAPGLDDINRAREIGGIVIAFDVAVDREVRRAARERLVSAAVEDRPIRVELTQVPDTRFTPTKGLLCLFLAMVGFSTTLLLGRMGGSKSSKA